MSALKEVLEALIKRENLSHDVAYQTMQEVAKGAVDPIQVSALLALLAAKGETGEEVAGLARAMREVALPLPASTADPASTVDIVGTGGDGMGTTNISTASSIVIASCGVRVAKHGNVSVSSKSGSADVLRCLGVPMLRPDAAGKCLDETGITFMFAPHFHPAMKHVVPVRRALKIRTVFNILGPLLNPFRAQRLMLGVYSPALLPVYAEAVHKSGVEHALIVHCCGLDELAPIGVAQAIEVTKEGGLKEMTIDAVGFGVPACTIADLQGGTPEENAESLRAVLSGGDAAKTAVGHTLALNSGAALYVAGAAPSIADGYKMAFESLVSGEAGATLGRWSVAATRLHEAEAEADGSGSGGASGK